MALFVVGHPDTYFNTAIASEILYYYIVMLYTHARATIL